MPRQIVPAAEFAQRLAAKGRGNRLMPAGMAAVYVLPKHRLSCPDAPTVVSVRELTNRLRLERDRGALRIENSAEIRRKRRSKDAAIQASTPRWRPARLG